MIDWTTIITTVLTILFTAGGVGAIFYFRENKQKAKGEADKSSAEAIREDAGAGKEMLALLVETKDFLSEMNKYNQETNKSLLKSIQEKDEVIAGMGKEIQGMKITISELQRQTEGFQKKLKEEIALRIEADGYKCYVEDCKLRQPPLKKESA